MVPQCNGKMFLADERGHFELDWFRTYNTFNFGRYQHQHKTPFGSLYVLNDDTLAGGKSLRMSVEDNSEVLILPVAGAVSYTDNHGHAAVIEAGECRLFTAPKGTSLEIANPFEEELVNFLQVWFKKTDGNASDLSPLFSFDINSNKNSLVQMPAGNSGNKFYIGKYKGREEEIYKMSSEANGLFVFVIEGAFEVQYRLLHARDGLALWNVKEVEWEALSNDAIILVMELLLQKEPSL
jgi:redox-sensitive bicupin YhaK (pirin superfamily)